MTATRTINTATSQLDQPKTPDASSTLPDIIDQFSDDSLPYPRDIDIDTQTEQYYRTIMQQRGEGAGIRSEHKVPYLRPWVNYLDARCSNLTQTEKQRLAIVGLHSRLIELETSKPDANVTESALIVLNAQQDENYQEVMRKTIETAAENRSKYDKTLQAIPTGHLSLGEWRVAAVCFLAKGRIEDFITLAHNASDLVHLPSGDEFKPWDDIPVSNLDQFKPWDNILVSNVIAPTWATLPAKKRAELEVRLVKLQEEHDITKRHDNTRETLQTAENRVEQRGESRSQNWVEAQSLVTPDLEEKTLTETSKEITEKLDYYAKRSTGKPKDLEEVRSYIDRQTEAVIRVRLIDELSKQLAETACPQARADYWTNKEIQYYTADGEPIPDTMPNLYARSIITDAKSPISRSWIREAPEAMQTLKNAIDIPEALTDTFVDNPNAVQALTFLHQVCNASPNGEVYSQILGEMLGIRNMKQSIQEAYTTLAQASQIDGNASESFAKSINELDGILARRGNLKNEIIGRQLRAISEKSEKTDSKIRQIAKDHQPDGLTPEGYKDSLQREIERLQAALDDGPESVLWPTYTREVEKGVLFWKKTETVVFTQSRDPVEGLKHRLTQKLNDPNILFREYLFSIDQNSRRRMRKALERKDRLEEIRNFLIREAPSTEE